MEGDKDHVPLLRKKETFKRQGVTFDIEGFAL